MQPPADVAIEDLLGLTLLIAVGFLLAVAFYQTLSTRDVLVGRTRVLAARLTARAWVRAAIYAAVVMVGIPILVVVWAVVVDIALFVLSPPEAIGTVAIVAVSVVGATRVLAYANERVSHELAKALPLALLFLLLTGGNPHLESKVDALRQLDTTELTGVMLAFLIVLEISLRIVTDGSRELLARGRRRRGIRSDLGTWRTAASLLGLRSGDEQADAGPGEQPPPASPRTS